jgi:hypothetical protein
MLLYIIIIGLLIDVSKIIMSEKVKVSVKYLLKKGDLEMLICVRKHECEWDMKVCSSAIYKNNMNIFQYAILNKCPFPFYLKQSP